MLTKKRKISNWILVIAMFLMSLLFLFPVVWMIANSFKPDAQITANMNTAAALSGTTITFADGSTMTLPEAIAEKVSAHKSGLILGIRGEDIKFDSQNLELYQNNKQKAVIDNTEIMGNENNLYFSFGGALTVARVSKYEVSRIGDSVEFVFMPHKMHFFDKAAEKAI